jgi:hypothetical protein
MKRYTRYIIWTIALIALFIISYWFIKYASFKIFELLLYFVFLIVVGLLIGLIPFKKNKYLNKISYTIPIVITLFGLYVAFETIRFDHFDIDQQLDDRKKFRSIDTIDSSDSIELDKILNDEWNYKEVRTNDINDILENPCITEDLEFTNLYPIIDSIAEDQYETLILVDLLKIKGFIVIKWGRGNWMEGPRVVSYTLSNDDCICRIDKLYYSTDVDDKFKVTERIKCRKAGNIKIKGI